MSANIIFKCPSCGSSLTYQPGQDSLQCPYCGNTVSGAEMKELAAKLQEQAAPASEQAQQAPQSEQAHYRSYHCQMCGAEIVTDETTAATSCYYCHSPVVLSDRLSGEFLPDGVIPFQLDHQRAEEAFSRYLKSHHFVDRRFFSKEQRERLSGVYYPYWLGDFEGEGQLDGTGSTSSVSHQGQYIVTTTDHFKVHREGKLRFSNMVRKALAKQDRLLSDGIHPYELNRIEPFSSAYLSGFLAEKRDVPQEEAQQDMIKEAQNYVPTLMKQNSRFADLNGNVSGRLSGRLRYVLLPAWVLTYRAAASSKGEPFFYLMNGQSGRVCGKLPVARGKLTLWCLGLGALVAGLLCLGGAMLW